MSGFIKQSTAHTFQLGPFIDDTDGKTAETGLTIAAAAVFLSKHGGAAAAKNDSTALTSTGDDRGYYDCVLNTTDTNTVGNLKVMAHISGALPVWQEFTVLPANSYDSLVGGTDTFDVSVTSMAANVLTATAINSGAITNAKFASGAIDATAIASNAIAAAKIATGAITNAKFASGAIDAAAIATDAITAAKIAADAIGASELAQAAADKVWSTTARVLTANTNLNDPTAAAIADAVWDEAATGHTDAGKAGQQLWTDIDAILTDTNELQTDWTNGGRLDLIADAILEDTNELQADDYPTTLAAIKTKTDSLTFTQAGKVDANITHVNEIEIDGAGTSGDPWGPAA